MLLGGFLWPFRRREQRKRVAAGELEVSFWFTLIHILLISFSFLVCFALLISLGWITR